MTVKINDDVISDEKFEININFLMRSKSEIKKFIFYTSIFIPIIIFILEITFLFINKLNTKFTNETKYDSLTGWRENCNNKFTNLENYKFLSSKKICFLFLKKRNQANHHCNL